MTTNLAKTFPATDIDPLNLPFVLIENRLELPEVSGVYFAIDTNGTIQYIGQSINLKKRWKNHDKGIELAIIGGVRIAYLECDKEFLLDIERSLIRCFAPALNRATCTENKDVKRLHFSELGEYYNDLLTIDAAVHECTSNERANALLRDALQQREKWIKQQVQYFADKRRISFEEMWNQIISGEYQKLLPKEFAELLEAKENFS